MCVSYQCHCSSKEIFINVHILICPTLQYAAFPVCIVIFVILHDSLTRLALFPKIILRNFLQMYNDIFLYTGSEYRKRSMSYLLRYTLSKLTLQVKRSHFVCYVSFS